MYGTVEMHTLKVCCVCVDQATAGSMEGGERDEGEAGRDRQTDHQV